MNILDLLCVLARVRDATGVRAEKIQICLRYDKNKDHRVIDAELRKGAAGKKGEPLPTKLFLDNNRVPVTESLLMPGQTPEDEMEEWPRIVSCLGELMSELISEDWRDDFIQAFKGEPL